MNHSVLELFDLQDLTSPVGIQSTSYRFIPVVWDSKWFFFLFESHFGFGNHGVESLIFPDVHPVTSMINHWHLLFYFLLSGSGYAKLICCNRYLSWFDRFMALLCRYFVVFFSTVIYIPRDTWTYFQGFVIAVVSTAFSNGATNYNIWHATDVATTRV